MPDAPKIKFCGLTSLPDAQLAVQAGAWAIGLIFWPQSRRRCELQDAAEIAAALKRQVEIVGVFVNPTLDEVARTADAVGLTMLQLHGDEGPVFCSEAARRTGCKVIKAARVRSRADIQSLAPFHTDYHLLDSYIAGVPGGTGETFAWEIARHHRGATPLILSGGLNPDNVAEAISVVRPFAVDVASGVELAPGRKDPDKLSAFAAAVASTATPPLVVPAGISVPQRDVAGGWRARTQEATRSSAARADEDAARRRQRRLEWDGNPGGEH